MNGFTVTMRRGVPLLAAAWLGAATAQAQQPASSARTTRQLTITQDSLKVTVMLEGLDSLVRTLVQSRLLEDRIGMALREYGNASRTAAQRRSLEEQLQKLAASNVQLLSKIQMACTVRRASDRAPEGYLGVAFNMAGSVKRESNGPEVYRFDEPPEVVSVEAGSPAERAGIRRGDRVLAFEGRDVVGRDVVLAAMLVPGRKLPVRIAREGREEAVTVLVQKRPEGFGDECATIDQWMPMRTPMPGVALGNQHFTYVRPSPKVPEAVPGAPTAPSPVSPPTPANPVPPVGMWTFEVPPPVAIAGFSSIVAGAQLTTLTDDFKELTGADRGVMVQRVAPETPAAAAGLKGGDVIVEAAGRPVTSARFLQRLIGDTDEHVLELKVVRKGKLRTVQLKWP